MWNRNSSSVVERGIAGPKVTGSIPVCSFFYYNYRTYNKIQLKSAGKYDYQCRSIICSLLPPFSHEV